MASALGRKCQALRVYCSTGYPKAPAVPCFMPPHTPPLPPPPHTTHTHATRGVTTMITFLELSGNLPALVNTSSLTSTTGTPYLSVYTDGLTSPFHRANASVIVRIYSYFVTTRPTCRGFETDLYSAAASCELQLTHPPNDAAKIGDKGKRAVQ